LSIKPLIQSQITYPQKLKTYASNMNSADTEFLKEFTQESISKSPESEKITRLLAIIEELQNEVKRLKRTQGLDLVKGKRQKPMSYVPNKDKI